MNESVLYLSFLKSMKIKVPSMYNDALIDEDLTQHMYEQFMHETYKHTQFKHTQYVPDNISCDLLIVSTERLLTDSFKQTHQEQLKMFALNGTDIKYVNKYVLLTDTIFRMLFHIDRTLTELISKHNVQRIYFKNDCAHTKYFIRNIDNNYYLNGLDVINSDERYELIEATDENISGYFVSKLRFNQDENESFHKSPEQKSRPLLNYYDIIDVSEMNCVNEIINKQFGYCTIDDETFRDYTEPLNNENETTYTDLNTELTHHISNTFNVRNMIKSLKLMHDTLSYDLNSYFERFDVSFALSFPTLYNFILASDTTREEPLIDDPFITPHIELEYPEDRPFDNISLDQKAIIINNFINNTAYYQCMNRTEEISLVFTFVESILHANNTIDSIEDISEINLYKRILLYEKRYNKSSLNELVYTYNSIIDFGDGLMFAPLLNRKIVLDTFNINLIYYITDCNRNKRSRDPIQAPYIYNKLSLTYPIIFVLMRTYYGEILDINSGMGLNIHPVSEYPFERLIKDKLLCKFDHVSEKFYTPNGGKNNGLETISYTTEYDMLKELIDVHNSQYKNNSTTPIFTLHIPYELIQEQSDDYI